MNENEIRSTWVDRELPILRTVLARLDSGRDDIVDLRDVAADTGLSVDQTFVGAQALADAQPPFLALDAGHVHRVFERGRRTVGTWPSAEQLVDEIVRVIAHEAETADEPERKSRLRTTADTLAGVVRDIAIAAAGAKLGEM